jgi:hypothetical protein
MRHDSKYCDRAARALSAGIYTDEGSRLGLEIARSPKAQRAMDDIKNLDCLPGAGEAY